MHRTPKRDKKTHKQLYNNKLQQTKEVEKVNKIYKNTLFSPLWNNLLEVYFLAVLKIDINLHHE